MKREDNYPEKAENIQANVLLKNISNGTKKQKSNFKELSQASIAVAPAVKHTSGSNPKGSPQSFGAFLNFDIERFADIPGQKDRYKLTYVCREVERGDVLPSSPEFHFIELEKFRKNSPRVSGELEKWLHLLSSAGNLTEIPREFSGSTAFDAYFEAAATAAFSKDELAVYIKDMTTKWDIELAMKEHFEDGRENAITEIAGRMLALGVSVDVIAKATGLTPEQIQSL